MSGVRADTFERVVQRFFEAAAVPEHWPQALHELAVACGAGGAVAMPVSNLDALGPVVSGDIAGIVQEGARDGWFAPGRNTRMVRSMALVGRGWRGVVTENDAFSPEDLARDPFHQEYIRPHGFFSYAGAIIAEAPGLALPISIERRIAQGAFQRDEITLMNRLFAHLRGAGELAVRVGLAATRRTAEAFAAIGHPVALIGRDGRIIHVNSRFERLVGDGLLLKGGRVGAWQADADRALAAAVDRAIRHDGLARDPLAAVVLPRREGLRPLVAHVAPVVGLAHDILHLIAAVVTVTDLDAESTGPAENVLRQAFGLTPAEARLAREIGAGKTLSDVAHESGSARETLRTRLKSVFDKTGTGRQAELALLLSKLAPPAE
jgi:DNA-binding CsgD family transcriptional regulator/PAS domain-containing protein